MNIDGRCHCAGITYEAEVDPEQVTICHCTDCQTLSGTAYRTVVPALKGSLRLLTGTPSTYVKTTSSGSKRKQVFCPECGTPIYSGPADERGALVAIRVGTARQRDELPPWRQIWFDSAQGWVNDLSTLPKVARQ